MSLTFAQKAGLRLCALAVTALMAWGMLHPSACHAQTFASDRITVTVRGQGPDVVFIPGLASSAAVWDAEAAKLTARYRVHLVEVAGFAGVPAAGNAEGPILQPTVDAIDRYIRETRLKAPAVVGHSLGGLMGLMMADQHPADVGRLMIVDSLPWYGMAMGPGATMDAVVPAAVAMRDKTLNGTQADYAASEPMVMARLVKSKGPAAEAAVAAAVASDHGVVARAMYEDLTTDLRPRLASIKTPVVMLYPWDATSGIPQAMMDGLYQTAFAPLRDKRLVRIEGSYHFIQIDQPEAFDREVQAFLAAP